MHGFEYRWLLLNPLLRGVFVSIAVAAFCASCLFLNAAATRSNQPGAATLAAVAASPATEPEVDWPRAAVRLWFLVPQLLPAAPR